MHESQQPASAIRAKVEPIYMKEGMRKKKGLGLGEDGSESESGYSDM